MFRWTRGFQNPQRYDFFFFVCASASSSGLDLCSYRPVVLSLSDFGWPGMLFLLLCARVNTQKSNQMKIVSTQNRNPDKKVDLKKKKVYLEVRGLDSPREIINRKND